MPAFFKCTLGNTYMLYVFDMATDQGRILEQAGILTYIHYDCMTLTTHCETHPWSVNNAPRLTAAYLTAQEWMENSRDS